MSAEEPGRGGPLPGDVAVRMPKLSDTLVEGTVARWLRAAGDRVEKGDPIADIETDKVASELVAPEAGVLAELVAPEGEPVPVESVIAWIRGAGAFAIAGAIAGAEAAAGAEPVAGAEAAPATKTLAPAAMEAPPPKPREPAPPPSASLMRRSIAAHMIKARATIPHGQTVMAADMTLLTTLHDREKEAFAAREGAKLSYTVFFVAALARAAVRVGPLLGILSADRPIHIGVAVALDSGLIVPVIQNAAALSLGEVAHALTDLSDRARRGALTSPETEGALMTVTNVGTFGNLTAFPIIPLGQIAILGPGLVEPRPMPAPGGGVRAGMRSLLALTFDRRALSDIAADRLLREVIEELSWITAADG